jgi:hypothetical protein
VSASLSKTALKEPGEEIESPVKAIQLVEKGLEEICPPQKVKRGDKSFGLWFRGHSSASHVLVPSILRKSRGRIQGYVAEVPLVRHFKAMNCDVVESTATDFDVLVSMQHYLAPTRLLDWTENLLVALHFAVRDPDQDKEDGALWILNARRLNHWTSASERARQVLFQDELDVLARSSLSRVRRRAEWHDYLENCLRKHPIDRENWRTQNVLKAIKDVQLTGDQIYDSGDVSVDVRHLWVMQNGKRVEKDLNQEYWDEPELLDVRLRAPVAVYPNRSNRRIRVQSGCFTLHGGTFDSKPKPFNAAEPCPEYIGLPITLHEIDRGLQNSRIIQWHRIPSEKKGDFRRTLAKIGITDATLFPELDYQSRYLVQRWASISKSNQPDQV